MFAPIRRLSSVHQLLSIGRVLGVLRPIKWSHYLFGQKPGGRLLFVII